MTTRFQILTIAATIVFNFVPADLANALDNVKLFDAIEKEDVAKFAKMIEVNPKPMCKSQYSSGPPAIHAVARSGSLAMMRILLKHGAHVNFECEYNGSVLFDLTTWCGAGKCEKMAEFLIERGARIDFLSAVILDKRECVTLALWSTRLIGMNEGYLEWNVRFEKTAVHWAAANARNEMIKILLEFGADVNHRREFGGPPIHEAIYWGHFETVKLLFERGADVNRKDLEGNSPLHYAIWRKQTKIAEFLLKNRADPNTIVDGRPYPVNAPFFYESSSNTPLHAAAENGDAKMIELLIAHGAKSNATNRNGMTPLSVAQEKRNRNAIETLSRFGGKPRRSYLQWAGPPHTLRNSAPVRRSLVWIIATNSSFGNMRAMSIPESA